jgi:hypothetical protein
MKLWRVSRSKYLQSCGAHAYADISPYRGVPVVPLFEENGLTLSLVPLPPSAVPKAADAAGLIIPMIPNSFDMPYPQYLSNCKRAYRR